MKKKKYTMSPEALKARQENAKKSTGPKTEDGKAASSMNGLTTGQYTRKFWKIPESKAGKLKMCDVCGDEQQEACKNSGTCLLHDELSLAYLKTHDTGDVKYIENVNILQMATMDLLFSHQLRKAQINIGEQETYIDADGNERTKDVIDQQFIYMLMNMMKNLNKSMTDMQLTKQTQDNIDVAWAELAKADIDPVKAAETKNQIIKEMAAWRKNQRQAQNDEKLDEAIAQHRKLENAANDDAGNVDLGDIGPSPFSNGR